MKTARKKTELVKVGRLLVGWAVGFGSTGKAAYSKCC